MDETQTITDAQLIEKYLEGDEASLGVLFGRHAGAALTLCRSLVGESEAEDAVQEASVKVWRNLKKFNPEKKFRTWFLTIAKNTCLDMLRKKRPTVFSDFENDEGENPFVQNLADDAPLPPEIVDLKAAGEKIRAVLSVLPPKNRVVLEMHYFEELTLQEIADLMNESVNTIKSRYRRGILALKESLDKGKMNQN